MGFSGTGKGNSEQISRKFQERVTETGLICKTCNRDRLNSEYGLNKARCKECINIEQKERYHKRKRSLW